SLNDSQYWTVQKTASPAHLDLSYCYPYYQDCVPHIVETHKVIHTVETDMVKLVVDSESFGKSSDEIDKETVSFDELQLKQEDLSCVHALNKLHLHEISVVPSKHEADQC
ncbi:hypothetical protein Tco_0912470, partial [Tanacetum coccineum]